MKELALIDELVGALTGEGIRLSALDAGRADVASAVCDLMAPRQHALVGAFNRAKAALHEEFCHDELHP